MKKIGIMGGTFNPVHYGHLHIAETAFNELELDEIIFMPNNMPAYKGTEDLAPVEDRVLMLEMAIANYSHFSVNTMEIERGGTTYTIDTLEELSKLYPKDELFFIIGSDSLDAFMNWREPKKILDYAYLLVAERNRVSINDVTDKINEIESALECTGRILPLHCPKLFNIALHNPIGNNEMGMLQTNFISSAKIRECFATKKRTVTGMLQLKDVMPKEVYQYIKFQKLY